MHLRTLVMHNAWSNRQLFGALHDVPSFDTEPGASLILLALDHIQVVGRIFRAHLESKPHDYTATRSATLPSLDELDAGSQALDAWYVEHLASFDLDRVRDVRFTDGKVVPMTPAAMILHVVTHTIHHRGNIDAIMLQGGMPRRRDGMPEFLLHRASAT